MQVNHGLLNVTVSQLRSSPFTGLFWYMSLTDSALRRKFYWAKNENVRYDDSNETLSNVFSVSREIALQISITLF